MAVYYCRIKNIISGQSPDIVVGETAEEVVEKTVNHLNMLGVDSGSLRANIRACVKQRETPPRNFTT
jgi:hypothetical protein